MNQNRVRRIRRPENSEARQSADNTAFWDYRKRVQDLIERMELEYDKALLALHPLGISVSAALYNQMIGLKVQIHSLWLLYFAWIAWGLGIIATLGSFRTSVCANRNALEKYDVGEHTDANHRLGMANALTTILNWSSGALFVIGVGLAALFLSRRL
jgi:hypothetical protein